MISSEETDVFLLCLAFLELLLAEILMHTFTGCDAVNAFLAREMQRLNQLCRLKVYIRKHKFSS